MLQEPKSIRAFIGAKDFGLSREFYRTLGFVEKRVSADMSVFSLNEYSFYLQDYYVKSWVKNSMMFLEVGDLNSVWDKLLTMDLTSKFRNVKLSPPVERDWGKEFFIHDPSGILWHIGEFTKK